MNLIMTIAGSIADVAARTGAAIAESFLDVEVTIVVDVSGSMGATDSRGGKSRYDVALEELAKLQASMPGRIALVAFSDSAMFVPGGVPPFMGAQTNLAGALQLAKTVDVAGMRFVCISDGEPDGQEAALKVARTFQGRIDCIFVGDEERPMGREFLARLAQAAGGQAATADRVQELAATVQQLLAAG